MTENYFKARFKSKSNKELERIATNSESFVFEARYAAITILKERNFDSTIIYQVEKECEDLEKAKSKKKQDLKEQDQRLIFRIRQIPIKGTRKYLLDNGNELQIIRLNKNHFQVRIKTYRSELAPVIICRIKDDSTYFCFPFFYLKSILIFGFGGAALTIILSFFGYVENEILIFSFPLIMIIGFQVFMMPFTYFLILSYLKKRLGKQ